MTRYYAPSSERCIIWNDADIGVEWENQGEPRLSSKDRLGKPLSSRIWSTQSLAAPVAAARKHWPGSSAPEDQGKLDPAR